MALITSCQATFQNFSGYEDDIASLEENIRECYSEITKTSEQINMSVREEFISRSELETIQKDFETSITQNSTEIRMDFTAITVRSLNWEKSGTPSRPNYPMRNWPLRRTGRRSPISPTRAL